MVLPKIFWHFLEQQDITSGFSPEVLSLQQPYLNPPIYHSKQQQEMRGRGGGSSSGVTENPKEDSGIYPMLHNGLSGGSGYQGNLT